MGGTPFFIYAHRIFHPKTIQLLGYPHLSPSNSSIMSVPVSRHHTSPVPHWCAAPIATKPRNPLASLSAQASSIYLDAETRHKGINRSIPGTWTWYWHVVEVKKQGAPNHFRGYKLPNICLTSTNMAWWNIRWNTWVPLLIRDQDNMLLLPYRFTMSPYMLWWHGPKFRKNAEWESHWANIAKKNAING